MLINGGTLGGVKSSKPESVQLMRQNQVAPASDVKPWAYYYPGAGFGYGLGFGVRTGPGEDGVPGFIRRDGLGRRRRNLLLDLSGPGHGDDPDGADANPARPYPADPEDAGL